MLYFPDLSHYNTTVDFAKLKASGVDYAIFKATQGNYMTDIKLIEYVGKSILANIIPSVYHWLDPLCSGVSQAQYALSKVKSLGVKFMWLDVEQQWANWQEWRDNNITQIIPPLTISSCARSFIDWWKLNSDIPIGIYTRASFLNEYAAPMKTWMVNGTNPTYPIWYAYYPKYTVWYPSNPTLVTWNAVRTWTIPAMWFPAGFPEPLKKYSIWQLSGERLLLPEIAGSTDMNISPLSKTEFESMFGGNIPIPPPPPTLTLEQRVTNLEREAKEHGWDLT